MKLAEDKSRAGPTPCASAGRRADAAVAAAERVIAAELTSETADKLSTKHRRAKTKLN
jgi:hypothetical protein